MSEAFLSRGGSGSGGIKIAQINEKVRSSGTMATSIQFDFEPDSVILSFFIFNNNIYEYYGSIALQNGIDILDHYEYFEFGTDTVVQFSNILLSGKTLIINQTTSYATVYVIGVAIGQG